LFPLSLGELDYYEVSRVSIAGHEVLKLSTKGRDLLIAEKISPAPVPESWKKRIGEHRIANMGDDIPLLENVHLRHEDGLLLSECEVPFFFKGKARFILRPISDTEAIIAGLGRGMGETIRVVQVNGIALFRICAREERGLTVSAGFEKLSRNELNSLASDVARLSRLLTSDREDLPEVYLKDERLRNAYQAYFLPSNISKIHKPLQELFLHPQELISKSKLRILDIGAGPGTASLGALTFFLHRKGKKPQLEFTAVDQVAGNLKIAESLFSSYGTARELDASLKTLRSDIEGLGKLVHGQFDVIILSNVMNELFARDDRRTEKRIDTLNTILKRLLADDGSCIIIEPALRETSREMLEVRDGLLEQGFHVFSPCLFSGKCPALANPKDWCHEDIPWDPPALVKEVDKLTGLHKDSLKFSYLVLRKDGLSLKDRSREDSFRVVSEPLVSKGKLEFYVCGEAGRRLVTRLDKDATSENEPYGNLKRGDRVHFEQLIDEGKRFKVGKETAVYCTG